MDQISTHLVQQGEGLTLSDLETVIWNVIFTDGGSREGMFNRDRALRVPSRAFDD